MGNNKRVVTYFKYGPTASQLLRTYHRAFANSSLLNVSCVNAPNGQTYWENTDRLPISGGVDAPAFLSSRLNLVSMPLRYIEQNVRHSLAMYASVIDPSGRALFQTYCLSVWRNLSMIHYYGLIMYYTY